MNIAIITSGILPVPAVQGGAVENLMDYILDYNNTHQLHQITIYSVLHQKVFQHQALKSIFNHYVYIDTKSLRFKIGAKLYGYWGNHYCYHYQLEYFLEKVWQKMKKKKYDLIILENRPGFALQLKERTKVPIISHIHTDLLNEPTTKNQSIVNATERFLVVSNFIKEEIQKVDHHSDIRIVYNGLDKSKFMLSPLSTISRDQLRIRPNDFVAVFWGRIVPKKGIKELIQALGVLKEYQDIKLLVLGSINYEDTDHQTNPFIEELKEMAHTLEGKIVFTGYIPYDHIPQYLSIADVAVIPSKINEALGMTCIEATAMGLPVIATNDGGIPETLNGQKHILIDKDGDMVTQLAEAILKVKNNYPSYKGNQLSSRFTKESFVHSFYENIILS